MFYKVYSVLAKKFNLSTSELFLNQVTEKNMNYSVLRQSENMNYSVLRQ